jgi:hypothetical protein
MRLALALLLLSSAAAAHDPVTTKLTFHREVSRVLAKRCLSCHQPGGAAPFSLTTYSDARPWAVAIRDAVQSRLMPPWNAVKGFGEFANDQALSQEEISLLTDWVNGGAPEGDPADASDQLLSPSASAQLPPHRELPLSQALKATKPIALLAIDVAQLNEGAEARLVAELPDRTVVPLLWLRNFRSAAGRTFVLAEPLALPAGARILPWPSAKARFTLLAAP